MTFKDKRIILTGVAGGIGEALAKQLAAEGARMALADLNAGGLESVAEACRELGSEVLEIPTDVTDKEQCRTRIIRIFPNRDAALRLIGALCMEQATRRRLRRGRRVVDRQTVPGYVAIGKGKSQTGSRSETGDRPLAGGGC